MVDERPEGPVTSTETPRRAALSPLRRAAKAYSYVSDVLTPQRVGLLLGALLLAVVGLFGGWGAASEAAEDLPTARVGEAAVATPFEVSVRRARYFDELAPPFYAQEGYRYLVVSVDVTNTTAEFVPSGILAAGTTLDAEGLRTLELSSGPRIADPSVVRTADALTQQSFQPGLTTMVALAWLQEEGRPLPEEVTVTFSQSTWRRSTLDDSLGWRSPEPVVRVTLPLEPLPDEGE